MSARGAVVAVARHELRRRWRSYVALGLLAGAVAAMVLSTFTLLRRTATAYNRLEAATHAEEARVNVYNGPTPPPEIARLPGVEETEVAKVAVGAVEGRGQVLYTAITSVPRFDGDLFTPVIVSGRAADPRRADEVVLAEQLARENDVHPGTRLRMRMLTLDQVRRFDVGFGAPAGPAVTLTVVGIMRLPATESSNSALVTGPAFARSVPPNVFAATVIIRLRHGTRDVPAFAAALDRLATRLFPNNDVFVPLQPSYPSDGRPRVAATTRVLVSGLGLIAAVSALAGLVVFAQAAGRLFAAGAADQRVEAALGLTPWERVVARLLPACLSAAVAVVLAVSVSVAAGLLEPLGALRRLEPYPGWSPNWTVSVLGALAAIAIVLLTSAIAGWRAGRAPAAAPDPRRSSLARLSAHARHAWSAAGIGFAFGTVRNRRRVPLRTVLVGVVVGIAGVVAAGVFVASLDRLTTEPSRYGWTADFDVADASNAATRPSIDRLVRDPKVAAVAVSAYTTVRIDGIDVDGYALQQRRRRVRWTLLDGRMPVRGDEVVLGTRLAHRLHRGVGDVVIGVARSGGRLELRVVGVGLGPDLNGERLGQQALLTRSALDRIGQSDVQTDALVRLRPGVDVAAFETALGRTVEVDPRARPADVQNLHQLGRLPDVLVAFLALIAAAALLHGLATTVRRRRRDIGVLRALGFTPGEARASILTAGLTIALAGLALGVPLGLSLGRLVWALVADATGVATDVSVPWARLALLVPAALAATALVSLVPGRQAARMRPAAVLRTE